MATRNIPERLNAATVFVDTHIEKGRGDKTAILCQDRTITYADLQEGVNRFGNMLRELDTRMEERVAILLPDIPEFAFAFFGTMKTGAVAVPLNTLLGPEEYEYLLNDSRARVLVVHASLVERIIGIQDKLQYLKYITVCGGDCNCDADYPRLEPLLQSVSPLLQAADTSRDDVAFWLYSSGTTGFPKGAVHLHHDMIVAADGYARETLGLNESDLSFSVAKLFFAYGLGNGLYFPLRVGGTSILLPDKPLPDAVFDTIDKYRPTVFYSVPTSYAALLQTAEKTGRTSLGRVRMCVSAGEPLPGPIFERWRERFGVEILDGIGSTEALHIFISNRPGEARGGTTGKPVPGYDARIVDDNGNEPPKGEIGTLLIRGDSIASGYWNKHEATKKTILGEWIDTRDKFWVDKDGLYHYAGRTDDMMKVSGQWVSPTDIEAILQKHPAVLESGVVGIPDNQGITTLTAHVALKEGNKSSSELALELQDFVRENTAPHGYACWIEFIDELPKTATGKIQRFKLRKMDDRQPTAPRQTPLQPIIRTGTAPDEASPVASQSEPHGPVDLEPAAAKAATDFVAELKRLDSTQAQRDRLLAHLQSELAIVLGLDAPAAIDIDMGFFDMGVDSVAAVAFTNRLEISLGHPLPATLLFKYSSLELLAGYIVGEVLEPGSSSTLKSPMSTDKPGEVSGDDLAEIDRLSEEEIAALIDEELGSPSLPKKDAPEE
uniref:Benzoate-CoA ligase n=1 Tax=Candidatus Kentrum sp. FW TaxID=2126338 RepID=A0A450T248_9GAMM|nr:MAG: benzoate-CoA ligase [Candidatus Kentron sp. FW]